MESLSDVLEKYKNRYSHLPDDVRYIPEDGLCLTCGRLINGHDGVEKVLSARGEARAGYSWRYTNLPLRCTRCSWGSTPSGQCQPAHYGTRADPTQYPTRQPGEL